jgi:hypothetical protein
MDIADLFVALKISNQPVLIAGSIIVSASRECVLAGVLIVNGSGPTRSTQTMTQGSDSAIWVESVHISYAPSLSFGILDKWNINVQHLV